MVDLLLEWVRRRTGSPTIAILRGPLSRTGRKLVEPIRN